MTSKGPQPWVKFSPFYPHGGIPIPLSPERTSESVRGIWHGLKVFESVEVDETMFSSRTTHGFKRLQKRSEWN